MELLVATRSAGKIREIRRILADIAGLTVHDLDDVGIDLDPAEDDLEPYDTFEENALSKANYFFAKSGIPTVADDSGIEIDALGGAPGVRSKRFASDAGCDDGALDGQALDDANNRHLMESLADVARPDRTARYVCVAVLVDGDAEPLVIRGEAPGIIVHERRGAGGFGYDPFVFDEEMGMTFAEMSGEEKNRRSHRGKAFCALAATLRLQMSAASAESV